MASYLILKQTRRRPPSSDSGPMAPEDFDPADWQITGVIGDKRADADGESAAITEAFDGPGRYAAFRCDNVTTTTAISEPKLIDSVEPDFLSPTPVLAEPPAEEPVADDKAADDPADPA